MSLETNKPASVMLDDGEPQAGWSPAPILLVGLFALLMFWGFIYLENHGGGFSGQVYSPYENYAALDEAQPPHVVNPYKMGEKIFMQKCTACHQTTGLGVPGQFPPIAGSDWVNAKGPNRIIRAVINGLTGPIKVKDQAFNNTMVPWGTTAPPTGLSDEEISYVLTFIRQNTAWGNDASAVTPEQVKAIHDKIKTRDTAFTPDELLKLPDTD
jgi:mono/diheme cytochrome c family protein